MPLRSALLILLCLPAAAPQEPKPHPIVPGFERSDAPESAESGRLLLGELGCVACHKPDAAAAEQLSLKKAPLLAEAGSRLSVDWIRAFVADPQKTKPGATMPRLEATAEEIDAISHFLMSLKRPKPFEAWGGPAAKAKELFNRAGCAACHDPLGGPAIPGSVPLPDLKAKYSSAAALADFLFDPHGVRPSGRMPKLNLTHADAMALATIFIGLPPKEAETVSEEAAGMRYDVFEGGFGRMPDFDALKPVRSGEAVRFDPKLSKKEENYALRFHGFLEVPADGIYTFHVHSDDGSILRIGRTMVVNNDGVHGGQEQSGSISLKQGKHGFMLGFFQAGGGAELRVAVEGPGIPRREIPAQALSHSKIPGPPTAPRAPSPAGAFVPDPALVEKGRLLFVSKRCASCHVATPNQKPLEAKPLAQVKTEGGCLAGTPLHYSLTPAQTRALSAAIGALAAMPKPDAALRIRRTMEAFNCAACHERDKRGGPSAERNPLFVTTGDDLGDEGRLPPHLTGVGGKLRRDWIQTVLGTGAKVRPYMATRMPVFGNANLGPLAEDFEKVDSPAAPPLFIRDPELVKAGRLLAGTKGMSCVTCHTFQNHKSLGIQGMDLVDMSRRLRRDWFGKYLLDPPSLRPGTRMPTYWPEGKSVRKDILAGDTERQIEALWQFLSEGGKAQLPIGLGPQPIPLVPVDEALIYRNFIQGAGSRAIAVGYPEKIHLAFDANQMRLALLWRGDFIDASKHWVDRGAGFQTPAGDDVLPLVEGAPFAVLPDPNAPWPKTAGHEAGYRFEGYELDRKRRPTFTYAFGTVEVRDFFEAVDAKPHPYFKRVLTFASKEPQASLWFRVAAGRKIEQRDGLYVLDNGLKLKIEGGAPTVRAGELLVPVPLKERESMILLTYSW